LRAPPASIRKAVVDVISKGAAQSWQMENRHKTMLANHFEHGFAVEWMRKDLAICLDEARRRRVAPGHRADRSVLCRSRKNGRRTLGHVEPVRAHGKAARRPTHEMAGVHVRIITAICATACARPRVRFWKRKGWRRSACAPSRAAPA
jgi:hypothetical protein